MVLVSCSFMPGYIGNRDASEAMRAKVSITLIFIDESPIFSEAFRLTLTSAACGRMLHLVWEGGCFAAMETSGLYSSLGGLVRARRPVNPARPGREQP
jgi:hypothetical protein